ncbi:MAG TPA: DNA polymerase III subunit epsilon [Thermopetrobacter sp.]|nr:DNA polymerase III subunit epsilon [Thermopetrobacter sp.]
MTREICLDTETTGLKPADGHRIIEIGAVELVNHLPTGNTFHVYINPERDIPIEAQNIHGISGEFLADKPPFADVADDFLAFIGDAPLIIHNAEFDRAFLNHELGQLGHDPIPRARCIDTLVMARRKFPGAPANLDALCRRFGIDLSKRDLHGALIDAHLLAEVYLELIGGRQIGLVLDAETAAPPPGGEDARPGATARRHAARPTPLPDPLDEAALKAHREFIDSALSGDPLWKKYD